MATTHIDIGANLLPDEVRNFVAHLKMARQIAPIIKQIMETMIDGSDYTRLESALSLQAGEGQTVYNLVAGSQASLDTGDLIQTITRLG